MPDLSGVTIQPQKDDSVSVYGTATAAAADAAIATTAALSTGLYECRFSIRITAGGTASVVDNYELRVGATSKRRLLVQALTNATALTSEYSVVVRANAQTISINAVGNEAAAVVAAVSLSVRKVGN
jgi:nucleoid-associated protein YgaU